MFYIDIDDKVFYNTKREAKRELHNFKLQGYICTIKKRV